MFHPSVVGYWKFNNSLTNESSDRDFSASISGDIDFTQFSVFDLLQNKNISRKGLQFKNGQSYIADGDFNFDEMCIAFWWYSNSVVGYARHSVTRQLQTKVAPILNKAELVSGTPNEFSAGTFFIEEVAASQSQNAIRLSICGSDGNSISHQITSLPYDVGLRHVMVTYLKPEQLLRIDIDGKIGILHPGPSSLHNDIGDLHINGFVADYASHVASQEGYIYNLIIKTAISHDSDALRMMRYGPEYISDADLLEKKFIHFGIEYSQPTTVSTTHISVNGSSILVGRSNGELLQGTRPIWDKEFDYINPQSLQQLSTSEIDPQEMSEPEDKSKRIAEWTTNGLRLKGVIARI